MTELSRQTFVTGQIYGNVMRMSGGEVFIYVKLGRGHDQQVRCVLKGLSTGFVAQIRALGQHATVSATGKLSARYGRTQNGTIEPEIVCQTTDELAVAERAPHSGPRQSVRGAIQLHGKCMLLGYDLKTYRGHIDCGDEANPLRLHADLSRYLTQRVKAEGLANFEAAVKGQPREITATLTVVASPSGVPGEPVQVKVEVEWVNLQA